MMKRTFLFLVCSLFIAACRSEERPTPTIAPVAAFTLTPENGEAPLAVNVNALDSTDDGSITSFSWDWGDGSTPDTGVTASHTFSSPGTFTLTLTVTDDGGLTTQSTKTLTVNPPVNGGNPDRDTVAPTIASVRLVSARGIVTLEPSELAPEDYTGVDKDANIVITFSEPMNQAATQAAFQSDDFELTTAKLTFTWNANSTELSIDSEVPFIYQVATAKSYSFSLAKTASDVAGNTLADGASFKFFTLRQVTQEMPGIPELTGALFSEFSTFLIERSNFFEVGRDFIFSGDAINAQAHRAFLTFDLSALPATVADEDILSAELRVFQDFTIGQPYGSLGNLLLEHVFFGDSLNDQAFNAPRSSLITSFASLDGVKGSLSTRENSEAAQALLNEILIDRSLPERGKRSQFRFRFEREIDIKRDDCIVLDTFNGESPPKLEVTYLTP